ncbi:hypothetical protein [Desulfogranum mediterraneum]|uniref:hypothetical protein n=1 Tax=Desulfogranum mediterraneum TaxID=160661 RepID=UPI00040B3F16|nr:hypothetical protein [Desulfogranum mediterraneum]
MLHNISHNQINGSMYSQHSARLEINHAVGRIEEGRPSDVTESLSIEGTSTSALTYSSDMQLVGGEGKKYGLLQNLVANLLKEQGINTKIMVAETPLDIAAISPEEAEELVADDGYFGVEQTSDRIFQFAVGVAGGDTSRLDAIKEGIDQGFNEALEAFGGWLPDISYATYDAVMEKLDSWVSESEMVV